MNLLIEGNNGRLSLRESSESSEDQRYFRGWAVNLLIEGNNGRHSLRESSESSEYQRYFRGWAVNLLIEGNNSRLSLRESSESSEYQRYFRGAKGDYRLQHNAPAISRNLNRSQGFKASASPHPSKFASARSSPLGRCGAGILACNRLAFYERTLQ